MANAVQVKNYEGMKAQWIQFKHERNMPQYLGKVSPSWLTMLQREELIEKLLILCDNLIKGKK